MAPPARRERRRPRQRPPDAHGGPVLTTTSGVGRRQRHPGRRLQGGRAQAPDRRGVPRHACSGPRRLPRPRRPRPGDHLGRPAATGRSDPQPHQEEGLRQPLLVSHHRFTAGPWPPLSTSARRCPNRHGPARSSRRGDRTAHRRSTLSSPGAQTLELDGIDRDYESIRVDMQTLFGHLGPEWSAA